MVRNPSTNLLKTPEDEVQTLNVEKTESFEGFAASDIDENTPKTEEDLPDWLRSALDENEEGKTFEDGEILDARLPDWLHNPPSPEPR